FPPKKEELRRPGSPRMALILLISCRECYDTPRNEDRLTPPRGGLWGDRGPEIVYIVDDEAAVRSALSRLLRSERFEVISFGTAEDFLAADHPADDASCLIVDLCMPGL